MSRQIIIVTSHRVGESLGGVEKFIASFSEWCFLKNIETITISRALSVSPVKNFYGPILFDKIDETKPVKKMQLPYQLYYVGLTFFSLVALVTLLRLIKKSRLKNVNVIMIHAQDINFAALATVLAGKLIKVPTTIHQHGPYEKLLPSKHMRLLEQCINKVTSKLSDVIIATDKYTKSYLTTIVSTDRKINVIPVAVDTQHFETSSNGSVVNGDSFKIGYIGRLAPEKNIETLLYAFKEFKSVVNSPCKLVLVGDGDLSVILKQLTCKLGINESVEFEGFRADIRPALYNLDVFVLPSKVEGTPIALIEAMAAGKAIIASNIPSVCEIVDNGKDALLFDSNSISQLKDALLVLFNDPELRLKLGKKAKNRSRNYSVDIVFSKVLQSYKRTLSTYRS